MTEKTKQRVKWLIQWFGIIMMLYGMTLFHVPIFLRNLWMVGATISCCCVSWKSHRIEKWETVILLIGMIGRVIFCYLNVYYDFALPIGGGDDGLTFMKVAEEFYQGEFYREYTKYPYVLYRIFQITGVNQFAAQYVNILCWAFAALLLQKSCKRLGISGKLRLFTLTVFAWLPTNIWISSILYRDTLIMLALFLSFYGLLCWMQNESWLWISASVGSVLFATWLHGGSIVALVPIVVTAVFYSRKEQKYCLTKKNMILMVSVLLIAVGLLFVPQIKTRILWKFPNIEDGVFKWLNRWLEGKYDYSEGAGSNYLEGRYIEGYFDFVIFTIQKIYYHMFSPVPHMWRGLMDAAAFFGSSAPVYLATTGLWAASFFYKRTDAYRFVLFMENIVTIGIYAWGNVNGGTAVRHREKILGLMLLLAMYSLKLIIQERKERKDREEITEH